MDDIGAMGAEKHDERSGRPCQLVQRADESGADIGKRKIRSRSACRKKIREVGRESSHTGKDEG
jgi:hypothetical protein